MYERRSCCPMCGGSISSHEVQFHQATGSLTGPDWSVDLTPYEGAIFGLLWRRRGIVIPREVILADVYAHDPNGGPDSGKVLEVRLSHIRKKLRESKADIEIVTVFKRGYFIRAKQAGGKTLIHGNSRQFRAQASAA